MIREGFSLQQILTQVEVVVLSVTENDEAANEMGESWAAISINRPPFTRTSYRELTHGARVLAAGVAVLVSLNEALGLGSRGRATGKLLVESNNPLHARGVGGTANGLEPSLSVFHSPPVAIMSFIICVSSIQGSCDRAVGGFGDHSGENGMGLRSTYVGRGDLFPRLARFIQFSRALHTFGGTRVETMFAVCWYVWDG